MSRFAAFFLWRPSHWLHNSQLGPQLLLSMSIMVSIMMNLSGMRSTPLHCFLVLCHGCRDRITRPARLQAFQRTYHATKCRKKWNSGGCVVRTRHPVCMQPAEEVPYACSLQSAVCMQPAECSVHPARRVPYACSLQSAVYMQLQSADPKHSISRIKHT